jgi:hypothetical protein
MFPQPSRSSGEDSHSEAESHEQLLEKDSSYPDYIHSRKSRLRSWTHIFLISFVSIIVILSSFVAGAWYGSHQLGPTGQDYLQHVQHYCKQVLHDSENILSSNKAPILKEVDTSLHSVLFNGSFMKENDFRKGAGPEVDAAWASLGVHCNYPTQPKCSRTYKSQIEA